MGYKAQNSEQYYCLNLIASLALSHLNNQLYWFIILSGNLTIFALHNLKTATSCHGNSFWTNYNFGDNHAKLMTGEMNVRPLLVLSVSWEHILSALTLLIYGCWIIIMVWVKEDVQQVLTPIKPVSHFQNFFFKVLYVCTS